VGTLFGFAPWIVYWVLVGNVPFLTAVLIAMATSIATLLVSYIGGRPGRTLQIGAAGTFAVLTVLTLLLDQSFMERWIQPLSNAGIFVVALAGVLAGRPFVREFAEVGQPPEVVTSALFGKITNRLTWIWVAVFAGMTVSSLIPPIVQGDATILDIKEPLSFVLYWVIPFALLALGAIASRVLPERMTVGIDESAGTELRRP
jgi:intracellular septation protein A